MQRNELYFLACGRHPDFGYVDQPPLVPLIAAATQVFGVNIWMLRLPATIAAAKTVDMPLRLDNANALPTYPQQTQKQQQEAA